MAAPVLPSEDQIHSILTENRKFPATQEFKLQSHLSSFSEYKKMHEESIHSPDTFWPRMANEHIHFFKPWDTLFSMDAEKHIKWFEGAQTNVSYNCLDRHIEQGKKDKIALIWEGENEDQRSLTYQELYELTCQTANALKKLGIEKGDRVGIYMPLVPEAFAVMLACARIGATHMVVFAGFSSLSLRERINDCQCKVLFTADGFYRKGAITALKNIVDEACLETPSIQNIVVLKRSHQEISMKKERDIFWDDLVLTQNSQCKAEEVDSEHPLFILYTSGTTGKPKGLVHTTAGYLLGVHLTSKYIFDLQDKDIFWCTADIGWITGHSYVVYGPLSNGSTVFLYEGAPLHPNPDRFWQMIERYKISILYTAPTAIRTFMRHGDEWLQKYSLSSLRLLGSVGEPINPEAWMWYHEKIGHEKSPIVDTWWQTETGSILIAPLPGAIDTKPGYATVPFFGIDPVILKEDGSKAQPNEGGFLCIQKPWPSIARTIFGNHERYQKAYWEPMAGVYFAGDGAVVDQDGYFCILGRIDDVLNVSGHRLGTMELESAIVQYPSVAECAVVGRPDALKGQGIVAFVTLKKGEVEDPSLKAKITKFVEHQIGAIARPDEIHFTEALPKTKSGKIMRRLLKELAVKGSITGDISTLDDVTALESLKKFND